MKKILLLWMMALLLCVGCGSNNADEQSKEETETMDLSAEDTDSDDEDSNSDDSMGDDSKGETTNEEDTEELVQNTEYVELYIETIQNYEKNHAGSECTYDLIYIDDDDIPELVAGVDGCYVSLYAYYEGKVYTLMDDWGYGAMGNYGYLYLPGQNVVYNSNADFAGTLVYETYMGMKQYKELVPYYYMEVRYFKDKNNNDIPDDNEYVDNPLYYYEGKQISEEKANDMAFDGKYEDISGSLSAESLMDILWERVGGKSSASDTTEQEEQQAGIDVEKEVAQIREWYYSTQENLDDLLKGGHADNVDCYYDGAYAAKVVVPTGYAGANYQREYYFKDKKLYFAFVFNGSEEYRFYFKDDVLIRYIDDNGDVYDYGDIQNVSEDANQLQTEAYDLESTMVNCGA